MDHTDQGWLCGLGMRSELLLCNRGELQTLNVESQPRGADVYEAKLLGCDQFVNSETLASKAG